MKHKAYERTNDLTITEKWMLVSINLLTKPQFSESDLSADTIMMIYRPDNAEEVLEKYGVTKESANRSGHRIWDCT